MIYLFYAYWLVGLVFGIWFVFRGAYRLDANLQGTGWGLRLMLLPGAAALWPVLLRRLFGRPDLAYTDWKRRHVRVWMALAIVLPVLYVAAIQVIPPEIKQTANWPGRPVLYPVVTRALSQNGFALALRRDTAARFQLEVEPLEPLRQPVALVFRAPAGSSALEHAALLGQLGSKGSVVFELDSTQAGPMQILIFEPIRQTIIASVTL